MGFKYSYDITKAAREINACVYDVNDPFNDGFIAWGAKQDLYRLKWILDNALKRCVTFGPEEEWLREHEKEQLIKMLSNDQ